MAIEVFSIRSKYTRSLNDSCNIINKDDIQNHIDALLETMKITNCILYLKQGIHFNEKKSTKNHNIPLHN